MELTKTNDALSLSKGYKQTEVGVIPEDWNVKPLNELALEPPKYGIGASAVEFNYNLPTYLRITDIGENGKLIPTGLKSVSHNESSNYILQEGDLVLARTGASVGKSYLFDTKDGQLVYAGFLIKISPDPSLLDSLYLRCFLNTRTYWNWVSVNSMRSGQPGINGYEYGSLPIPLPPTLTEQKAIATALSDVDALISSLEKLIAKKKAIKQGAMQELLTPPHKGGKRLPGFSGDWEEETIEELSKTFTKQTGFDYSNHIKPTLIDKKQRGHLPFIQNKDFDGHWVNFDTDYYIPEDVAFRFPRILLNERCLIISISGSIGKVGVFNNKQTAFIGGAVAVGKFFNPDVLDWVMYYLQSEAGQNLMLKDVKAGSHQNLILDDIRKMRIPMPKIEEQKAIAQILSDMDLEIEVLEVKKAKYQGIKQGMMQELLTGKTRLV